MNVIEIKYISKYEGFGKKVTEVNWKYKDRQKVNYLIDDNFFEEKEIIEYLNKLINEN
tara:strand:- start:293 stop:466 length:174 start_codon:yes stop_codon:yes gene_type:complete